VAGGAAVIGGTFGMYFPRRSWLTRLLFVLTLGTAVLLVLLVLLSPLLDNGQARLLALFARDAAVRRTAVASALALVATACVCFRPARRLYLPPRRLLRTRRRQPPTGTGA
jgi:hypothetical protein